MMVHCYCGTIGYTAEDAIRQLCGPSSSEQWLYWSSQTAEQKNRNATMRELEKLLQSDVVRRFYLHALSFV